MAPVSVPAIEARSWREPAGTLALWLPAAIVAAATGFLIPSAPLLVLVAFMLSAAAACCLLAFVRPRAVFVVVLFLVEGYVPDVASIYHAHGLPLTGAILAGMILPLTARYALGMERLDLPVVDLTLILALALTMAVSTAISTDPSQGVHRIVFFCKDAPFMVLMLLLLDRAEWLRRAAWAASFALGGLGALAVLQQVTKTYDRIYLGFATVQWDNGLIRSAGPLTSDWFGWELVPGAVLSLYLALSARSHRARLLALGLFVGSLLGVVYSFARASLIAMCAALLLAGILRRINPVAYVATVATAVALLFVFLPSTARSRLVEASAPLTGSVATASDASVRNRAGENLAALEMFLDHPYLGVGPGNYPVLYTKYSETIGLDPRNEGRHPHNLYLEAFAETGLVGGLLLLALFARALLGAWRARSVLGRRDALLAEGVFVATVGYLVNGFFLHPSAYSRYLWLTIGFGLVCGRLARHGRAVGS